MLYLKLVKWMIQVICYHAAEFSAFDCCVRDGTPSCEDFIQNGREWQGIHHLFRNCVFTPLIRDAVPFHVLFSVNLFLSSLIRRGFLRSNY